METSMKTETLGLVSHMRKNTHLANIIFYLFPFLLWFVGFLFVYTVVSSVYPDITSFEDLMMDKELFGFCLLISLVFAIGIVFYSYFTMENNPIHTLKPILVSQHPLESMIQKQLSALCIERGIIPEPRLHIIRDRTINACSIGHSFHSSHIIITTGAIEYCTPQEIKAILAHELGHIFQQDARLVTIILFYFGAIHLIFVMFHNWIEIAYRYRFYKIFKKNNFFYILPLILFLLAAITRYFVAPFLFMVFSEKREILTDAFVVELTKDPESLISVLEKIDKQLTKEPLVSIHSQEKQEDEAMNVHKEYLDINDFLSKKPDTSNTAKKNTESADEFVAEGVCSLEESHFMSLCLHDASNEKSLSLAERIRLLRALS